jgi:hypothetical protein
MFGGIDNGNGDQPGAWDIYYANGTWGASAYSSESNAAPNATTPKSYAYGSVLDYGWGAPEGFFRLTILPTAK